jgi:rhodanese-related sulfurtransferase
MDWKQLFTPVKAIEPEEAKALMAGRPEGSYTLLDVRQPGEYEKEHLPGAKLVPMAQLPESLKDLDPEKPVIVY